MLCSNTLLISLPVKDLFKIYTQASLYVTSVTILLSVLFKCFIEHKMAQRAGSSPVLHRPDMAASSGSGDDPPDSHTSKTESDLVLKLVLLGNEGVGKSASGNTILGQQAFLSKKSHTLVTQDVAVKSGTVFGFPNTVFDTPGISDKSVMKNAADISGIQQVINEKFLQKCESSHCVFLLVIKADSFTEKERKTVEKIEELLGETRLQRTWILFTRGDELEEENMTIKEFLDGSESLKSLIQKYDHRYHVFNNKIKGPSDQVRLLLVKILQTSLGLKASDGGRLLRHSPDIRANTCDEQQTTAVSLSSRRIVLLGKTGVGKSAAGNTILGQKEFESEQSMDSVTRECLEKHATVSGKSVSVVDTPGFFDTQMKPEVLMTEIARSVYLSSPGPHAFFIVLRVNDRFTEHEQQIPQIIEMMFGDEVLKYSIILFTHGDQIEGKSVEKLIEGNSTLRHLVQQCGGRYHVFNNRDENNREQVNDLLHKIDTMIEQNGGEHYSNQMYEDAQRFRREEERRQRETELMLTKEVKKIGDKLDAVNSQYEIELEKLLGKYKHSLHMAAFAVSGNVHTGKIIGAFIGGSLGAVSGIYRGPGGVAAGATAGATAGVAVGAFFSKTRRNL